MNKFPANIKIGFRYDVSAETSEGCWTGKAAECKFDPSEWQKTKFFKEVEQAKGSAQALNSMPQTMYYFGTAPICNAGICDVVKEGKYPVGKSVQGDGAACGGAGYMKQVGVDPVTSLQFDKVFKMKSLCEAREMDVPMQEKIWGSPDLDLFHSDAVREVKKDKGLRETIYEAKVQKLPKLNVRDLLNNPPTANKYYAHTTERPVENPIAFLEARLSQRLPRKVCSYVPMKDKFCLVCRRK